MPALTSLIDPFFSSAFTLWGSPTSWAETLAFTLALAMVGCNIREIHWGWPLAIASSCLYYGVFWRSRLYGEALLQIFFAVVALWGWLQWVRGGILAGSPFHIARLSARGWLVMVATAGLAWPAVALFLQHYTNTDVAWWDAFPTALSIVAQFLLGRKLLENWAVWLLVNLVGTALFAYKGLWLTAILYGLFAALSIVGWRIWHRQLQRT